MKTNILKKCACLLLIGGLFAPVSQIKANEIENAYNAHIEKIVKEIIKETDVEVGAEFLSLILNAKLKAMIAPYRRVPAIRAEETTQETATETTEEEIEKEIRQRSLFCTLKKEHYPTQELFETISA